MAIPYTDVQTGQMSLPAAMPGIGGVCGILARMLGNETIHFPHTDTYSNLQKAHWSHTAWKQPDCIFVPPTPRHVQEAMPVLVKEQARFAIRSGGHMPAVGAASADNAVLIDLSHLDRLDHDPENHSIVVGAGQRWKSVYNALDEHKVTVVGGRILDVGVAGLTLGGGLSYLSDLYGLVCDNVIDFEVVLSDGSLVNANSQENPNLFSALKGGSNNLGIVTAFTLRTHPIHSIWGGTRIFAWEHLDAVLDALLEFQSIPNTDPYASINLNVVATNQTDIGIILTMVYLKPEPHPDTFAPFSSIPALMDTTRVQTLTELLGEYPSPNIPRIRFIASTFNPTKETFATIKEVVRKSPQVQKIKSLPAGTGVFTWQAISPSLVDAGNRAGGNALGLEAVRQVWFHIDLLWWNEEDDEAMRIAGHSMMDEITTKIKAEGSYLDFIFMNDADERQDVISSYGSRGIAKLVQAQEMYDPDLVFQRLAVGAFKLPRESS